MPTSLTFDEHLDALDAAGRRLVQTAGQAGLDAAVPSCPDWTVRDLLAHMAKVHRWATINVMGADTDPPGDAHILATVDDLLGYTAEGCADLVAALRAAPADLVAFTFLKDPPSPRQFWARRQAHETTMHAVDALAASLGRLPTTSEAAIDAALAADGLDELLCGFFTRGRSKLFDGEEETFVVAPVDHPRRWIVHVAERLTVEAVDGEGASESSRLTGTAAGLYLALWNRGEDMEAHGRAGFVDRWRATQRVSWS